MATDRRALLEYARKLTEEGDADLLREAVKVMAEAIMEAEVTGLTGAAHGERAPDRRLTHRNGGVTPLRWTVGGRSGPRFDTRVEWLAAERLFDVQEDRFQRITTFLTEEAWLVAPSDHLVPHGDDG